MQFIIIIVVVKKYHHASFPFRLKLTAYYTRHSKLAQQCKAFVDLTECFSD